MYFQHLSKLEKKCSQIIQSKLYSRFLEVLVILSVISMLLSTFRVAENYKTLLLTFSFFSGSIYLIDYFLRIVTAPFDNGITPFWKARLKYIVSFYGFVDFAAMLPFVAPFFFSGEMVRDLIELGRILLIFKIARYSRSFKMVIEVFNDVKWELLISVFIMSSVIFVCAVLMYYVERNAQPEVFKNVGDGLWWAIITYTTVGYGDIYPITMLGRALSAVTALVGISMVAFPTGIISTAFMRRINQAKANKQRKKSGLFDDKNNEKEAESTKMNYCPHCGKKLNTNGEH